MPAQARNFHRIFLQSKNQRTKLCHSPDCILLFIIFLRTNCQVAYFIEKGVRAPFQSGAFTRCAAHIFSKILVDISRLRKTGAIKATKQHARENRDASAHSEAHSA